MNYKRVLSGVILFPIMAIIFIFGNTYFVDTLISIIAIMGLYEYYNAFKTKNKPVAVIGYIAAAMLAIIHVIPIDIALKVIAARRWILQRAFVSTTYRSRIPAPIGKRWIM